ncbi:hypothetical protein FOL47_000149 [Perkinsus chesapeaki]|uniref:Major facilitator superfamily (MFS) profile domain-containing protein n=1 Tax=Perkinsus chesapeaki TaxID=330153 RepID=A0A7J6MMH3_PERCH|nr:hypothetical protein FOL47_000149 [Perkinsus chesapeaki]
MPERYSGTGSMAGVPPRSSFMLRFRVYLVCSVVFIDFVGCESLGLGKAYSLTSLAHAIGMTISPPIMGLMSDRLGRRPLLLASMLGISISYTFQGLTRHFWWFVFFRLLTGLAGGGRPVAMAYATDTVRDPKRRTAYLGYINMIPGLCIGAGPAIGGLCTSLGLFAPFFIVAAAAAVTFILLCLYLPESHHECMAFDVSTRSPGGTLRAPLVHEPAPTTVDQVAASLLYSTSCLAVISTMIFGLVAPLVFRDVFGLDPMGAGFTYLGDGVFILLGTYFFVYLCNTLDYSSTIVTTFSILINGIGTGIMVLALKSLVSYVIIKWVLLSTTMSMFYAGLPNIVAELSPKSRMGELMGFMTLSQGIGRLIGTSLAGPLYDADLKIPFYATAAGCLASTLLSWCLYCRMHRKVAADVNPV